MRAEQADDAIVLRVRDTGMGIPPAMLEQVFDLFAQGERTIDRSEGGLGIGLTLARRIVAMHGGSIKAASEGAGKGAEFVVRLPRLDLARVDNPGSNPDNCASGRESAPRGPDPATAPPKG